MMDDKTKTRVAMISVITIAAILVVAFIPGEFIVAKKPLHMFRSNGSSFSFMDYMAPCDVKSNMTDAPGTPFNPAILKQGGHVEIRICGMNLDSKDRTYIVDAWSNEPPKKLVAYERTHGIGSDKLNFSEKFFPGIPGQPFENGLHVNYPNALVVKGNPNSGVSDMSSLKNQKEIKDFVGNIHHITPAKSHFDIIVSADQNATLGVHPFTLGIEYPDNTTEGMNTHGILVYVNVVS